MAISIADVREDYPNDMTFAQRGGPYSSDEDGHDEFCWGMLGLGEWDSSEGDV